MGYVFDQEKSYIDTIKNVNTITYDNRSNLSDYFLSDSLELDGWDVVTIHPFDLKEFDRENGEEILIPCNMMRSGEEVFLDDMTRDEAAKEIIIIQENSQKT